MLILVSTPEWCIPVSEKQFSYEERSTLCNTKEVYEFNIARWLAMVS